MSHPTWVRGLKLSLIDGFQHDTHVAPYVGAWIETSRTWVAASLVQSHPTWVRGLKHHSSFALLLFPPSHPTWVRGLKHQGQRGCVREQGVAPYVGAWIETLSSSRCQGRTKSHPTWVRGLKHIFGFRLDVGNHVAPYVGAWIETIRYDTRSGPTGVAPYVGAWIETVWKYAKNIVNGVAPYVGAWIETSYVYKSFNNKKCRTLRGCVD